MIFGLACFLMIVAAIAFDSVDMFIYGMFLAMAVLLGSL